MSGAERGSSSAMRVRVDWRTLGEWVRQPAPAQAGPGILSTLLLILCATYQGGMIGSAVLTGRVGDGDLVAGIAPTRIGFAILIVAVMGSTALLTARRRYALAVFLAECAVYVVASALGLNNFFLFPVLVALGSAVSRLPLWQHLAVIGAAFLMATASAVLVAPPEVLMEEWLSQVVAVLLTVIAAMMARSVANWRAAQAGAKAERERFRALRAERDRAVNRADIAAELHDSVGHGLTTIIALSEGLAGGADPEIDEALGGINEVARECLEQTRRAVRALADAEERRRRRRRRSILGTVLLLIAVAGTLILVYNWTQSQYYVGISDGKVAIYQGIPQTLGPISLSHVVETYDEPALDELDERMRKRLEETVPRISLADARTYIEDTVSAQASTPEATATPTPQTPQPQSTNPQPSPAPRPSASRLPEDA